MSRIVRSHALHRSLAGRQVCPMLLACVLACTSHLSTGAAVARSPSAALPLEAIFDGSLRPGEDFFAWANSAWLVETEIPAGKDRWTARSEIDAQTRRQIVHLLDDACGAPAGSDARKVADFRAAYLNETAIEERSWSALAPALARIDAITDRDDLARVLGTGLRADVDPLNWGIYQSSHLLGLSVEMGNRGEPGYVAFLLQGGLGLRGRDLYLDAEPRKAALRARYENYIATALAHAGFDRDPASSTRAASVLALETAIASSHATAEMSANDRNADNLWTRDDFARRAPGMDWSSFFAAAGMAYQPTFVVWQPGAIEGAAALVASRPLAVWKDYLRFREIDRYADLLPAGLADAAQELRVAAAEVTGAAPPPGTRAERAEVATLQAMSEEVGRVYSSRHFPAEAKARVEAIVADVVKAFRLRVEQAKWMTLATRTQALAKLDGVRFGVGYPEPRTEDVELEIDRQDAVGNAQRLAERAYRRALARVGRPVDRSEWWIAPQTVGALLLFQQNAYNFPAALLQPPKFDPAASDAANYGAIGAIVGHEVSHFVDTLGAQYDVTGAQRCWWTPADVAAYEAATAPLIEQFSAYHPFPDLAVDGKRTLSENLADLGGLSAAFDAYRSSLTRRGSKGVEPEEQRRLDREFFIGFARSWRSELRPEALRAQVTGTDSHAPDAYRIATVRNLDAWYEAFDVQPSDRLYLAPEKRVRVW